jgi:hypothetical protein
VIVGTKMASGAVIRRERLADLPEIWFASLLVQRRTLAESQSESSFRWEEAERSQLLRDLLILGVFGGFSVTVATMPVLSGDMSEKYPHGVIWAIEPVLLSCYLLVPWVTMIGQQAKAWRRVPGQLEDATS